MKTKIRQSKVSMIVTHGRIVIWGFAIFMCAGFYAAPTVAEEKDPGPGKPRLIEYLQKASAEDPADYALSFYLGQLYLQQGEVDQAIAAWENFLSKSPPESSKTIAVKERLTVLKIASAETFARDAVRRNAGGPALKAPENSVAVVDFINNGGRTYTPFVKGLTAMIMTDLSKAPQLKVLEREKIQALLREMQLGQLQIVDPKTSARMGRMLMAGKITSGSMNVSEGADLAIQAMVSDTERAAGLGNVASKGDPKRFFELEKEVVVGLLKVLGVAEEKLDPKIRALIRKEHTKDMDALMYYGEGLLYLEKKDFGPARQAFGKAIEIDPNFDLASEAFQSTPEALSTGHELGYDRWFVAEPTVTELQAKVASKAIVKGASRGGLSSAGSSAGQGWEISKSVPFVNSEQHAAEIKRLIDIQDLDQRPMGQDQIGNPPQPSPQPNPQPIPQPTPQPGPQPGPQPNPQPSPQPTPPTAKLGFAVAAVDKTVLTPLPTPPGTNEPFPPVPVTSLAGVYQNTDIQDLSQSVRLRGAEQDQLFVGSSSQVTAYQPQVGSVTESSLPYAVAFTSLGYNSYLEWGYWLGNSNTPMTNGTNTDYTIISRCYFVQGLPATNAQMNSLSANNITGTYRGNAYATLWNNAGGINLNGSYSADVAFQNGRISNFNLSAGNTSHTVAISNADGNFISGSAAISINANSGAWTIDAGNAVQKGCRGAVYGPNAEHMGGTFSMTTAAQTANGAFAGTR